jgi:phosphonopyruvate decarboxylase
MTSKILLTPGPINVSFDVKKEMLIDYGSRDDDFLVKVQNSINLFFDIFQIDPLNKCIFLQGSGTYGVESVLSGIPQESKILLLINGSYGKRMKTILERNNKNFDVLEFNEETEFDYKVIETYLVENNHIEYISFVHLETSTGILNNIDILKELKNKYNKKLIVDCIASLGSDIFNFNDVDFLITSCNKCIQSVPGFTIIIAKNFENFKPSTYVLDIQDQYNHYINTSQFRFTPPTHILMAFYKALEELKHETLIKRINRFKHIKKCIYELFILLNIKPFIDTTKYNTGNVCHTFLYPENNNFSFEKLYNTLKSYGFVIYPGKLTSKLSFRIGSIGDMNEYTCTNFLRYFELCYTDLLLNTKTIIHKISPNSFCDYLNDSYGINFFAGVPDSLLQDLNNYILDTNINNYIVPNEGLALSMAAGYYISTDKIPCVYLQNSGIGNLINPLLSLSHSNVYSIPSLLIIGWRGEPNVEDEPQHISHGKCMINLIQSMGFEYVVLDKYNWRVNIDECVHKINTLKCPVFLIVKKNTFEKYSIPTVLNNHKLIRRNVIEKIALSSKDTDILCCTTGKSSRELDEITTEKNIDKFRTFLMVGSMGHVSSLCLGMSLYMKNKKIYCIDGDGALLMHFGIMPYIAHNKPKNFIHILLNNAMHESVGIQPTIAQNIRFDIIAKELGYVNVFVVKTDEELDNILEKIKDIEDLTFIHILLSNKPSQSDNLSRPKTTPKERIIQLIEYIQQV